MLPPSAAAEQEALRPLLRWLRAGDTFVWVGLKQQASAQWATITMAIPTMAILTMDILTKASAPWAALRRARVRTIYYQTEPILVSSPAAGGARHGAAARWCMVSKVRSAVS